MGRAVKTADLGGHQTRGASTLRNIAEIPVGTEDPKGGLFAPLPETPVLDAIEHAYAGDAPVIVGHYWKSGTRAVLGPKVACVDYSAGKVGRSSHTSGAARPNSSARTSSRLGN